jgi:hypothetical protein
MRDSKVNPPVTTRVPNLAGRRLLVRCLPKRLGIERMLPGIAGCPLALSVGQMRRTRCPRWSEPIRCVRDCGGPAVPPTERAARILGRASSCADDFPELLGAA